MRRPPERALLSEFNETMRSIERLDREIRMGYHRRRNLVRMHAYNRAFVQLVPEPGMPPIPEALRESSRIEADRLNRMIDDLDEALDDLEDARESLFLTLGYGNDNPVDDDDDLFDPLDDDE